MMGRAIRRSPHSMFLGLLFGYFCLSLWGLWNPENLHGEEALVLTVQGLPSDMQTDAASVAEQNVVARFKQKYPHITVRGAEGLRIENINTEATTMMMVAGGIAPDVIRMQFRSSDTFIRQGIVAPLDNFLSEAKAEGDDILDQIPAQILPVIRRTGPQGVRHVYGLPTQTMLMGLYFNKDVFDRADLPLRAPKDWEELTAFAKKINALGPQYHGLYLAAGASAAFHFMTFLWSAGGDAIKEVAPEEWRAVFNSPEAVTAFTYYYQLVEAERVAYRSPRAMTAEEMAKVGMVFRYIGDTTAQLDPNIWQFGAVPRGPTGLRGSEINAPILGIFAGIKDAARKQAAWDYIRFVTSEEAERIRVETLVNLGQAATINPAALRKFGFEEYLFLTPKGLEEEIQETFANSKPEPYGKNCNLIYPEMTYPIDQILLSGTIRDAWNRGDKESVRAQIQEILNQAVNRTNARMIGYVEPHTMQFRRIVAGTVVAVILVAFLYTLWCVTRAFSHSAEQTTRPVSSRSLTPWLCLLPAVTLMLVWDYIPLARGTQIAFLDYQVFLPSVFVGLDNFAYVLFSGNFWNSVIVTLYFAALNLTFGFAAPILLAYALHLIPRQKMLFRTLYYLPAVISGPAIYFLWKSLFDTEGVLNQMLRFIGFSAERAWTQDPWLAMLACVIPGIWAATGPGCLIYLAALKTIPEEQFEAAEIDGAGFLSKSFHVIFPGLRALIIINFIGAASAAFQASTNILIMTGGGPNGATEVTALTIFYEAFTRLRFGSSTAMAWIISSMLLGFTVNQLQRLSRMEFKTAK